MTSASVATATATVTTIATTALRGHVWLTPAVKRSFRILAIETSCDDTSVSLLQTEGNSLTVLKHLKKTLNSVNTGGIVPIDAIKHHQMNLPLLLQDILRTNTYSKDRNNYNNTNQVSRRKNVSTEVNGRIYSGDYSPNESMSHSFIKPDIVMVTRGPGMIGSLAVGLNIAKGFCLGNKIPLLGVNHMLGHLLIPRMNQMSVCQFPMLSLLVSGGHTLLVYSENLIKHEIVCNTVDIAIGDSLDKCGRAIGLEGIMIGKELEKISMGYIMKKHNDNADEVTNLVDLIELPNPFSKHNKNIISFSFASFISTLQEQLNKLDTNLLNNLEIKRKIAFLIQRAHFNHLITKMKQILNNDSENVNGNGKFKNVKTFICSGGVSSNKLLREMLNNCLKDEKFCNNIYYPPIELCTDNSIMIGYAGFEILKYYQDVENVNISNKFDILPLRKWSLEELVEKSSWIKERKE